MLASELLELDRTSRSASPGSGTVETASGLPQCSEEHQGFLAAVFLPRQPRLPCFTVLGRSEERCGTVRLGVEIGTSSPASSRSEGTEAHLPAWSRWLNPRQLIFFREAASALAGARRLTSGKGPSCIGLFGLRWVNLRAPKNPSNLPTLCLRVLPSPVMNYWRLTALRKARCGTSGSRLDSDRALSGQ